MNIAVGSGKVQAAANLGELAPFTFGLSAIPAAGAALSGAGNFSAAGMQLVGALTGNTSEAAQGAKIATTVTSPTGFITMMATGGNVEKASKYAAYEAILTTSPKELLGGSVVSATAKVIDYIQNLYDAFSH